MGRFPKATPSSSKSNQSQTPTPSKSDQSHTQPRPQQRPHSDPHLDQQHRNQQPASYPQERQPGHPGHPAQPNHPEPNHRKNDPDRPGLRKELLDHLKQKARDKARDEGHSAIDDPAGSLERAQPLIGVGAEVGKKAWDVATGGEISRHEADQKAREDHGANIEAGKQFLAEGGAANKSDELLDSAAPGLGFFDLFLPRLKNWTGQAPDFQGEIVHQFDELREIQFGMFREDAKRLEGVHAGLLDSSKNMKAGFQSASSTWKGAAADAAGAKVDKYVEAGTKVTEEIHKLGGAIGPAVDGIEKVVRDYSGFVLDVGKEITCAGKSPDDVDDEIRKARGDLKLEDLEDVGLGQIFGGIGDAICENPVQVAARFIVGSATLGPLGIVLNAGSVCNEIRQHVIDDAKKWLDGSFKPEMQKKITEFQQRSTAAQQSIQEMYDKLLQAGTMSDNPFQRMQDGDSQGNGNGNGNGNKTGGGGDKTGGGGNTGGGGGGITPPPGAAGHPGAPGGMPGGAEHPGPVPGQPGPGGAPQEEVSIGEGKDKVTVGEPGHNGHSKVTLIGPDGQPKTYDVAFPPDGQQPGQPTPGMPGVGGTPVQPGPDGKAVIHEGDRSITLEKTPDGQVKVSIDNGHGQPPTNQTIGFGHSQSAGPAGMPGQQAGPGGAQPAFAGGAGMPAGGNSFGSASGQLFGSPEGAAPQGSVGAGAGAGGAIPHGGGGGAGGGMPGGHPAGSVGPGGSAGVAAGGPEAPAPSAPVASGQPGAGQGGMGQGGSGAMMGGMGAMGGQGQGGGDQERHNSSPWRTEGQLFEDGVDPSSVAFSGVIGEDRNTKR